MATHKTHAARQPRPRLAATLAAIATLASFAAAPAAAEPSLAASVGPNSGSATQDCDPAAGIVRGSTTVVFATTCTRADLIRDMLQPRIAASACGWVMQAT